MTRRTLPNGIRLLVAESAASETTVLAGVFVAGAAYDPSDREGLAHLTASVAQRATTSRTYEQVYDQLDALGASFALGAGTHTVAFRAKCLVAHWPAVAELVVDILRRPSFPEPEFHRARGELLTALRELDDSPRDVAERELCHLIYPHGHPYHAPPHGYHASVEALGRDDLAVFYPRFWRPDALILSLVGPVGAAEALERLGGLLGDWERPADPLPPLALAASHPPAAQRSAVPMPDKSQADIALGFKAIPRRHADFYALSQATLVVGGFGLMGRLGANVRDRQGLAYGISARMSETFGDGPWVVHAGVSPAHVERAVASILDELRHLQDEPVTDPELADVQSYLVGVLPVRLETNDGVAATLNHIEVHGLGDDYLDRYPDLVRSVTREAVQRAAQEHLTTDRYSLALAGPPTRAEPLP